ncbi:MAG TPA: MBL fold metallo-hydrolase [Bacteroidales bacterium]|nr:MBL fold metallo-hydrolase [Bacteroidales bacterium]
MKLSPVHISNFKVDGGSMFGVVPKVLWSKKSPADEDNLINLALRSLVVENGTNIILIDNGWGDKQSRKFFRHVHLNGGDGLEGGLRKAGYSLEDITDVVLTHLHADHCGGGVKKADNGKGYEMVFSNARYWVSRQQWNWAIKSNPREADSFLEENLLPMMEKSKLHMVENEDKLFEDFSVKIVNGHTPGQLIPVIDYKGTKLVYVADLIPTVAHIPLLWNMSYDLDQLTTIEEKREILEESLANNYILFFEHDVFNECCTLKDTPKGIRENRLMRFSDI